MKPGPAGYGAAPVDVAWIKRPAVRPGAPVGWGLTDEERRRSIDDQVAASDLPLERPALDPIDLFAGAVPNLTRGMATRAIRGLSSARSAVPRTSGAPAAASALDDLAPLPPAGGTSAYGAQAADDLWWARELADTRAEQTAMPLRPGVPPPGEADLPPLPPLRGAEPSLPPLPPPLPAEPLPSHSPGSMPTQLDVPVPRGFTGARGLAEEWMLPGWKAKYGQPDPALEAAYNAANTRRRALLDLAEQAGVNTRGEQPWRGQFMRTPAGRSAPTELPEPTEADFALANIKAGVVPGAAMAPAPTTPVVPVPRMMQTAVGRRR